jgi:hypothetical protein
MSTVPHRDSPGQFAICVQVFGFDQRKRGPGVPLLIQDQEVVVTSERKRFRQAQSKIVGQQALTASSRHLARFWLIIRDFFQGFGL